MPQISNLKLFFSTTNHTFSPGFPLKPNLLHPLFLKPKILQKPFSVVSFSARRGVPKIPPWRKNSSTLRDTKNSKEKAEVMEETKGSAGFNKRRAEGNDKNDKFKNLQLKVRKLNPINTISYVQILGTGMDTQDTSPSILLFFDKQRFIFNAGEGLQRYCTEHKIKLSKVDHIFLSRVCSETAGGLPGLLLTLAGMGDEGMSVKLSGPSDLKYLVKAMRSFIPNAAMLHTESFGPTLNAGGDISDLEKFMEPQVLVNDEVVKISAILIRPRYPVLNDNPSIFISSDEEKDQCSLPPLNHSRTSKNIDEAVLKPGDLSVIYVCELPEIKGKFDPAKAADLGLRPGPKYRELQLGKSVKSDRQNIMVHPSDVLGPSIPGPTVLLIDCPTLSHLEDLLSKESLSCYYTDSVNDKPENKSVNCIIHLSPSSVTMTATYQSWMKKFDGAQHIMAGHEKKNIEIPILKSSARVAARLNYLCPQFFPSPGFWCLQHLRDLAPDLSEAPIAKPCDSISAENLLKFHLRPYAQLGLDRSGIPSLMSSPEVVNELLLEIPEIADSMEQVNQLWNETIEAKSEKYYTQESIVMTEEPWSNGEYASIEDRSTSASWEVKGECDLPSCLENITREDMEFVLLGTGSSQPSKYRNVSSIYVNLFSNGGLLLDCGEGSLGQLKRRFGVKGADDAIRSLKCIWISHIHADHHTGLARILSHRRELLRGSSLEPLLVIGPRPLQRFLDAYQMLEDLDMQFVDCRHTTEAALASFASTLESSERHSSTGSPSADDKPNKKNIETSLFAKGSRMESYWKRPSSPVDTAMSFEVLNTLKKVLKETGLESLISVPVVHCPQAYAVVLKAAERTNTAGKTIPGWKLVYSGDTRPCPALVDASHGATVLIHEATFEDGLVEEAIARNHSTTKEAIEVGDSAGAYRIILTHFSQRYPKIPIFDETHMHKTCIGFDLMSVNVADLPVLPKVLPHLQLLFKNEMIADEIDDTLGPLLEQ